MASKIYKHINRVGIEFEGLWYDMPSGRDYDDKDDGSIEGLYGEDPPACDCLEYADNGCCDCPRDSNSNFVGELASDVLYPDEVENWVERCTPHKVNNSCGTHIHMSFLMSCYYGYIADAYYDCIKDIEARIKDISAHRHDQLVDRLENNTFCKRKDDLVRQWGEAGDRYTAINFCPLFHDARGTVEFRMLPGFTRSKVANACIHAVLDSVEEVITRGRRSRKQVVLTCKLSFEDATRTKEKVIIHKNSYVLPMRVVSELAVHMRGGSDGVGGV